MRFFRTAPRILPAHPTEAEVLSDLYRRAWSDCERLLDGRMLDDLRPPAEEVQAWLHGGFELYRIRHEGHLIGAVRCCFPSSTCYIDRLAVDPEARGRGVGHLLLEHAIGRARRAGVTRAWAQTSPKVEAAHVLFDALGFRDCGRFHAHYWGEDVVLLELPI